MLLIKCPWCGERDMVEFAHGGDATKIYPKDPDAATAEEWHDFVYLRDNPRGVHVAARPTREALLESLAALRAPAH